MSSDQSQATLARPPVLPWHYELERLDVAVIHTWATTLAHPRGGDCIRLYVEAPGDNGPQWSWSVHWTKPLDGKHCVAEGRAEDRGQAMRACTAKAEAVEAILRRSCGG